MKEFIQIEKLSLAPMMLIRRTMSDPSNAKSDERRDATLQDSIRRLHLCCGADYREGYINVDYVDETYSGTPLKADIICDLNQFPWPWEDDSIDLILMNHAIEHFISTERMMREVHRILKPGGIFVGRTPFCGSDQAFINPDHVKYFHWRSFHDMKRWGFEAKTRLISEPINTERKVRDALLDLCPPFRRFLALWLRNIYESIEFEMVKQIKGVN